MKKFKEISFLKNLKRVGKSAIYGKYWDILNNSHDLDDLFLKIKVMESKFSDDDLLKAKDDTEKLYNLILDSDIHVITIFDEVYPKKLNDMGNKKPLILYVKGNVNALNKPNIAFIGTRKPYKLSEEFEATVVKAVLNSTDRVIVSGLALGCDKIAHEITVNENNPTIAVLPSGVNVIKPAKHKKLAQEIIEKGGCLISEYEPDKIPYKKEYVERDAIVAALSDATFVVQCGVESGTMHTVDAANDYKRQIYAYLPDERPEGSYDGNELIIKSKNGVKVEKIDEFLSDLKLVELSKQKNLAIDRSVQTKLM